MGHDVMAECRGRGECCPRRPFPKRKIECRRSARRLARRRRWRRRRNPRRTNPCLRRDCLSRPRCRSRGAPKRRRGIRASAPQEFKALGVGREFERRRLRRARVVVPANQSARPGRRQRRPATGHARVSGDDARVARAGPPAGAAVDGGVFEVEEAGRLPATNVKESSSEPVDEPGMLQTAPTGSAPSHSSQPPSAQPLVWPL